MNPLTEARQALAATLAPLGVRVYATPIETPATPCIMISPAEDAWVAQQASGGSATVSLSIRCAVGTTGGNERVSEAIEDLVWSVLSTVRASKVAAPRSEALGQVDCVVADLVTVVRVSND
jgi:hypothetical protein